MLSQLPNSDAPKQAAIALGRPTRLGLCRPVTRCRGLSASRRARGWSARAWGTAIATILAAALAAALLPVSPVGAVTNLSEIDVTRYGGADRYATSLRVAQAVAANAGGRLDWVVIVPGDSWTDAVVAAPIAGALGAPVLASPSGELRTDAVDFLKRTGVSNAVVVGADSDTDGVGPTVVTALESLGISTERITRADQYATGIVAARRVGKPGSMGALGRTAVIANGEVFADALVAGAFAARGSHPILLNPRASLHGGVASYLTSADIEHVVLMGGPGALHQDVEDALSAMGLKVTRVAGATRYDTATEAAKLIIRRYDPTCFTDRRVGLARARVPFDSFSAAPLLARLCTPLLLANPDQIPAATAEYLHQARTEIGSFTGDKLAVHVFGGNAAVSSTAIDNYLASGTTTGVECDLEVGSEPRAIIDDVDAILPVWSPDCRRFAYEHNREIWTADVDGSNRVKLTRGSFPAWSPDGMRIAFARFTGQELYREVVAHLHVINSDGTGEVQLTNSISQDYAPRWSPDGRRILFRRIDLWEEPEEFFAKRHLAIIDADGRNEVNLETRAFFERAHHWTHDGELISIRDGGGVATVRDDGSDWRPVWAVTLSRVKFNEYAWSPDGCRIALIVNKTSLGNGQYESSIKVLNLETDEVTTVVRYTGNIFQAFDISAPQWSPDGRFIAYHVHDGKVVPQRPLVVARIPPA